MPTHPPTHPAPPHLICVPLCHCRQMTLYVPGPVLREGANELVLLEVERAPREDAGKHCSRAAWPGSPGPEQRCCATSCHLLRLAAPRRCMYAYAPPAQEPTQSTPPCSCCAPPTHLPPEQCCWMILPTSSARAAPPLGRPLRRATTPAPCRRSAAAACRECVCTALALRAMPRQHMDSGPGQHAFLTLCWHQSSKALQPSGAACPA